jgi:hypothetical protein
LIRAAERFVTNTEPVRMLLLASVLMRLADQVARAQAPFLVKSHSTGAVTRLSGASDYAAQIGQCPTRYVLTDELTRVCAALAYSKGAQALSFVDLIHAPCQQLWIEWCEAPWQQELSRYGFSLATRDADPSGRRGAWVRASSDGRRGVVRTFWSRGGSELDIFASAMEAHFDLDLAGAGERSACTVQSHPAYRVVDHEMVDAAMLRDCFGFSFESSWARYYHGARVSAQNLQHIAEGALGTIAPDIPLLLSFFLLLGTRAGLPQRVSDFSRLNRSRSLEHKAPLLEHIEVHAPLIPDERIPSHGSGLSGRRGPRLHHVRGHLVRRQNQLLWRVPHLRGSASAGRLKARTVTWTFDRSHAAIPRMTNAPGVPAAPLAL